MTFTMTEHEKQMLLSLLMEKSRTKSVEAPPRLVSEPPPSLVISEVARMALSATAAEYAPAPAPAPAPTYAAQAARPPVREPWVDMSRPQFRAQRTLVMGSGTVRNVNGIDYEYLRDYILGGINTRGPVGGDNYPQFHIFRGIYDMHPELFQHLSDVHTHSGETYFSFVYTPGSPHWDIKFHAHGRFVPHPTKPGLDKFLVTRVEWFMGKRDRIETGSVLFRRVSGDETSSDDGASTVIGE